MTTPRPTLGDERTNWRRFAANAAVLAVYWTMAAALLAAATGMTWLATVLAWSVCVLAVPAVVMGRL
jgi:hypothetical protein